MRYQYGLELKKELTSRRLSSCASSLGRVGWAWTNNTTFKRLLEPVGTMSCPDPKNSPWLYRSPLDC
jgi:hypothetical protein